MSPSPPSIGLLLSGGLDSAILANDLLSRGHRVQPFFVRCGMAWEELEWSAVRRFLAAIASPRLETPVVFEMPLADLYGDHWSFTGIGVPDDSTEDEAVYLPGRNPLLLVKPAIWCLQRGVEQLALGLLGSNPFSDASPEFFARYSDALGLAVGGELKIVRPFSRLTKAEVMLFGARLPLELTFSCLTPRGELHCGECNKCGERKQAFSAAGLRDATSYAK